MRLRTDDKPSVERRWIGRAQMARSPDPIPPGPDVSPAAIDVATVATAQTETTEPRDRDGFTQDERRAVEEHKRDMSKPQDEAAVHDRRGSRFAGPSAVEIERGADGQLYVAGSAVPIDLAPILNDPAATIRKMDAIRRVALAPEKPSEGDLQLAARATQQKIFAEAELAHMATRPSLVTAQHTFQRMTKLGAGPVRHGKLLSRSA